MTWIPCWKTLGGRFAGIALAYHCPDATRRTLSGLRMKGYRLGPITNRDGLERLTARLDQLGLPPYPDRPVAVVGSGRGSA